MAKNQEKARIAALIRQFMAQVEPCADYQEASYMLGDLASYFREMAQAEKFERSNCPAKLFLENAARYYKRLPRSAQWKIAQAQPPSAPKWEEPSAEATVEV